MSISKLHTETQTTMNHYIDLIQDAKKAFVTNYIPHSDLQKILFDFVDAQTAYTKSAVETGMQTAGKMNWLLYSSLFSSK